MRPALLATKEAIMPYLGRKPLSETAPNHPFARSQISFGVKRPGNSKTPSRTGSAPEESQAPVKPKPKTGIEENNNDQ
jgi:hypothetical protein